MNSDVRKFDETVAALTAPGQPFALDAVRIGGVEYRNYSTMPANLGQYFLNMQRQGDKDFAVYLQERYTYAQGYSHSAEFAAALLGSFGVAKGDRVAILSRNNPQWMMAFVGVTSIGAVAVPMNAWWTTEELDYGFQDSGARVVVADRDRIERLLPIARRHGLQIISVDDCSGLDIEHTPFADLLAEYAGQAMPAVDVAPEDYATIMYTSGSTGHPKGALSSHRGILSALYSWMLMGVATKMVAGAGAPADKYPPAGLLTVPLFHCTASHSAFMLSVIIGRKLVIMHKWDPQEALRLIEQERITWFNGVPTMSAELQAAAASSDRDISSLAEIMAGGAARPPDQVGKISATFKRASPGIGYGLTETNALGAVNSGAFYVANPRSTG
ncbi:MAG: class I adenylate-forming enzyme family protein, partial [Halieaceae bacterium]|nr:class I adenylate-forming enzyme family protein [Halieaceae bacterium]